MRVAIITAGGAGMYCGSCLHDNGWARGLIARGVDASLIPTYTPIRVDGENVSTDRVFLGGINVYLEVRARWWRHAPGFLKRIVDKPWFIRAATRLSISNDASVLGDLTLAMLAGPSGPLRPAYSQLATFIANDIRPDVVILSNALLAGCLPQLREVFQGSVHCVLQGDDVFLDALTDTYRERAIARVSELAQGLDACFTHSAFYRNYMSRYLGIPTDRFRQLPLAIDTSAFETVTRSQLSHADQDQPRRPFTVGYFARIAPEKGLQHLISAFGEFRQQHPGARLRIAGFCTAQHCSFLTQQLQRAASWSGSVTYHGSPDNLSEKVSFLQELDVLSVPTDFQEPKGIYVLEALAAGVPVVQPSHGAFPELIESTGGGLLVPPLDPSALAHAWEQLAADPAQRRQLSVTGRTAVLAKHSLSALADATLNCLVELNTKKSTTNPL